jgi:ABC-2 type transport system permease protein
MGCTGVVLRKELAEIASNRLLLVSLSSLPVVMVGVSLLVLATYALGADEASLRTMAHWYVPAFDGQQARGLLVETTLRNSVGLFLAMPVFLPVLIASQSIAGEKERRTLEALLATPATAREIVLGKSLAAVIPAMGITLAAFAAFAAGADALCWRLFHRLLLPDGGFLFALLVLAPLLSFLGTCISVLISARVGDTRLAQSLAGLLVMPFFGLVSLQFAGLLALGPIAYASLAIGTLAADVLLLRLSVRFFDRDRLLTRWS